ncbi:hypothetical protein ABEP00_00560 [Heyndrickxia sporothermodurans]
MDNQRKVRSWTRKFLLVFTVLVFAMSVLVTNYADAIENKATQSQISPLRSGFGCDVTTNSVPIGQATTMGLIDLDPREKGCPNTSNPTTPTNPDDSDVTEDFSFGVSEDEFLNDATVEEQLNETMNVLSVIENMPDSVIENGTSVVLDYLNANTPNVPKNYYAIKDSGIVIAKPTSKFARKGYNNDVVAPIDINGNTIG